MPSSQPSFATQIPNEYDDLNRLSIEVEAVKEHARVLQSTLMDATARTFEEDPIIKVRARVFGSIHESRLIYF